MVAVSVVAPSPAVRAAKTLDIYFIDVEGGQATLVVTPEGESLLIDTGFPSDDALIATAFGAKPGASANGRDPKRILAAARDAGLTKIDYLLLTHYHADHAGGAVELSQLMPIRAFVDHGAPAAGADEGVPGTQKIYEGYVALRAKGRHVLAKPGEHLELKGVEAIFVSADGATVKNPSSAQDNRTPRAALRRCRRRRRSRTLTRSA